MYERDFQAVLHDTSLETLHYLVLTVISRAVISLFGLNSEVLEKEVNHITFLKVLKGRLMII